jgi:uncharacterized protein (UPF0210 family)
LGQVAERSVPLFFYQAELLPEHFIPDRIHTMKLRSITCFIDPSFPLKKQILERAGEFLQFTLPAYIDAGYEVQSTRLAIVPFPKLLADFKPGSLIQLAQQLEDSAVAEGFDYVSVGPAIPEQPDSYLPIPEALAATENVFFSGLMTTLDGRVSLPAVRHCAQVILRASTTSENGFGNLRFAALANVPAGSPFFPAAYHLGGEPAFAIATEAADLAVSAFSQSGSLEQARASLVQSIQAQASAISAIAVKVERQTRVRFGGIDFSLAPFPSDGISLGNALERLGVPRLGEYGSLAAAAILADTMDQAEFMRAGFSGLMLPVLEDSTLARRSSEGSLGVKDLLLYSSVCGTGLDCIPLPGDTSSGEITAILLDLASLSSRLGKPLTARLMPIPGKKAGDPTGFDWAFFANSRVLSVAASPLEGFLAGDETYSLRRRDRR